MIQVDLDALKVRFYNAGKGTHNLSKDDINLFLSLDRWQRKELNDAMEQGKAEGVV